VTTTDQGHLQTIDRPLHAGGATEHVISRRKAFHADIVAEVADAVAKNPVVVVGMAVNPSVGKARKALDAAGIPHVYLGYGGYFSMWRQRLAIKLWSGWPTYPQVFIKGRLVGGYDDLAAALANGSVKEWLAAP
jgi:glutaredoxin-related protein